MARVNQDAIETFISITGASEAVAIQRLEEHGGDLNEAVNSYFNEGDRNITHPAPFPASEDDFMSVDDDPIQVDPLGPTLPLLSAAAENFNPFAALDANFRRSFFEGTSPANFFSGTPFVTHPREVREIPIEVKDENNQSSHAAPRPTIEDVSGSAYTGPEIRGNVVIDDDEEDEIIPTAANHNEREVGFSGHGLHQQNFAPSAPGLGSVSDYSNDIEEEMIRAAIEASKQEVNGFPNQHLENTTNDSSGPSLQQTQPHGEDAELARAVSLSLQTAEQEKALREEGGLVVKAEKGVLYSSDVEELGKATPNGRQGIGLLNEGPSAQPKMEAGSSSFQDEAEDVEEQPLVRQRSRRVSFGSDSPKDGSEMEDTPPSSPGPHDIDRQQRNGNAFHTDEWGGISSEEHDEAVMLEAAIFGGIPDGTAYRFGYQPQQSMPTGLDRSFYPQVVPRPPSPTLTAQRLLREQQDDEYLASLQADREKELKAMEEAEACRLREAVAKEAALEEEKQREEESLRKLLEQEEIERQLAAKEASLPQEPTSDDENSVTLLVRMPDGSRRGRRFLKSDNLQSLFDFIDVGRVVKPGTYRLVRPYPRRAFSDGESQLSLSDLGLTSKQEALFLELI